MLKSGSISSPTIHRYLLGHPVSQLTTAMFCVGLAALGIAAKDIVRQFLKESRIHLDTDAPKNLLDEDSENSDAQSQKGKQSAPPTNREQIVANHLLEHLNQMPERNSENYLWNRLKKAVTFIQHNHGSDGLDEHLRTLAEEDDLGRMERYSLVKILIWATPMLGFLGTVIGISEALGGIGGGDFQQMMERLKSSLYVAFDTTALALTFSILLMFVQFVIDRFETQLLTDVDTKSRDELSRHYSSFGASVDANLLPVHRLGRMIMTANHELVQRQVELWQKSIEVAQTAWLDAAKQSQTAIQEKLTAALDQSTKTLASHVQTCVNTADQKLEQRWEQWQVQFSNNSRLMREHQDQMLRQSQLVERVVTATGDVIRLQDALEKNLSSLSSSNHFEDAVSNLSAVIHLLHTRLGQHDRDSLKHHFRVVSTESDGSLSKEVA